MSYLKTSEDANDDARHRAAQVLARGGVADATADRLDEILTGYVDHGTTLIDQHRDAVRAGTDRELAYPAATISDFVTVVAALRAAVGLADTPTGREVDEAITEADVTTPEYDALRMHLFATHCNVAATELSDRDAREQHHAEHHEPGGLRVHDSADLSWTDRRVGQMFGDVDDWAGHENLRRSVQIVEGRRILADPVTAAVLNDYRATMKADPVSWRLFGAATLMARGTALTMTDAIVRVGGNPGGDDGAAFLASAGLHHGSPRAWETVVAWSPRQTIAALLRAALERVGGPYWKIESVGAR